MTTECTLINNIKGSSIGVSSHYRNALKIFLSVVAPLFAFSAQADSLSLGTTPRYEIENNVILADDFESLIRYQSRSKDSRLAFSQSAIPTPSSHAINSSEFNAERYNTREFLDRFSAAPLTALKPLHSVNNGAVANDNSNISSVSDINITPVPLPATVFLFGSALAGFASFSHWKHRLRRMQPYKSVDVLGIKFRNLNYDQAISLFQEWVISKTAHQVCLANVHTVVSCLDDEELRTISNNSLSAMDGLPLVWYARFVHEKSLASRVCGPELMLRCLDEGRKRDWTHFFLGGTELVLNDLVDAMHKRFPGVNIVGWHSPPFRALSTDEDQQLVDMINAAKPDFLWVGLGAPKQEKWIAAHLDRIHVPVQLGVGAAFNFHSGHVKRAPRWMQNCGLEWLYRASKEARLLKRYLATNPVFLLLLARDILLIRFLKLKIELPRVSQTEC